MRLAPASETDYLNTLFQLYDQAFPIEERMSHQVLIDMAAQNKCDILAIMDDQQFIGLSICFQQKDIAFLAYFAIEPSLRGQGYGSQALSLIKQRYPRLLLEIETTYLPDSMNQQQRLIRKKFYRRNQLIPTNYTVSCFGVEMEILSTHQDIRYCDYYQIYEEIFGPDKTASNIQLETILLPEQIISIA